MTSPKEFLTFPLLRPHERVRLAAFVARCQLTKEHDELDDEPLLEWLRAALRQGRRREAVEAAARLQVRRRATTTCPRRTSGRARAGWARRATRAAARSWAGSTAATRRSSTRSTNEIVALGGEVHAGATVEQIAAEGGRATGVVVDGRLQRFDHVLCTLAPPMARRLLAPELAEQAPADHCRYLGVVCLLLRVNAERQPVLPPEHHRPASPADDGRRDHARGRSGARRRAPALRLEVRRPGAPGSRALAGGARADVPGVRDARSSPTCATTRSSRRSCSGRG